MSATRYSERQQAIAMLLLANLFWGLSFPLIKAVGLLHARILPEAGTWFSSIYTVAPRFLLATALLALWQRRQLGQVTRLELKQGVIMGFFAAGGMLLQNDGLHFTSASTSAFLTQLYAILIPIWVAFHSRRSPGRRVWIACALVLIGVATLGRFNPLALFGDDGGSMRFARGEVETLLSSLFFMGQILWLEKKEYAANRPERLTLVMFATEAVVFGALALVTAPSAAALAVPWTSGAWLTFTLMLTGFCTIAAFLIMNTWQPKISATEAGLMYCVEPIFSSALALFLPAIFSGWAAIHYPNERLTLALIAGGGMITAANILIQLRPPTASPGRSSA